MADAVHAGRNGRCVGDDEVSQELLAAIVQHEGGLSRLTEFFDQVLQMGEIPQDWHRSILSLIPKTSQPEKASELRPIALNSHASKTFARILLRRARVVRISKAARNMRAARDIWCAIQASQLTYEWGCIKLDIAKAFDAVDRLQRDVHQKSQIRIKKSNKDPKKSQFGNLERNQRKTDPPRRRTGGSKEKNKILAERKEARKQGRKEARKEEEQVRKTEKQEGRINDYYTYSNEWNGGSTPPTAPRGEILQSHFNDIKIYTSKYESLIQSGLDLNVLRRQHGAMLQSVSNPALLVQPILCWRLEPINVRNDQPWKS